MKIYFNNDGKYGQSAVHAPIIINDKVIGFIAEVDDAQVTCYLWDRFVFEEQCGLNAFSNEQNIRAIVVKT